MSHEILNIDEHTRLVQLRPEQADRLFELTDNNREYLGQFLPWPPHVKVVDDSRKHIEETLDNRALGTSYTYGIEYDEEVVGDVSLRNISDAEKPPEIGYWISPKYSGLGLTTKAVQTLTNLGINTLGLNKIIIKADPQNIGSNKVAKKAGYVLVRQDIEDGKHLNIWSTET